MLPTKLIEAERRLKAAEDDLVTALLHSDEESIKNARTKVRLARRERNKEAQAAIALIRE
ncbi:hypothetical protein [Streptomyces lavendulae]|uniref:hypothetical protein n=1 Tax=Streptomyces lavendulae TaxID=1914 RepID=UPI00131DCB44|nr:hypothetical protein [Streptomyces lavendulae]